MGVASNSLASKVRNLETTPSVSGAATFASTVAITGVLSTTAAAEINAAAPTLAVATESTDTIAVTFTSTDAAVEHYIAKVYDTNGLGTAAAFTIAETGVGAEVFGTGTPTLLFTTDASGVAEITITDAAGASGKTPLLTIEPICTTAETREIVLPCYTTVTFD